MSRRKMRSREIAKQFKIGKIQAANVVKNEASLKSRMWELSRKRLQTSQKSQSSTIQSYQHNFVQIV